MLDIALISLIRDMSEKAGIEGTIQYWQRVGESLAKRMGKEAYVGWPSFNALNTVDNLWQPRSPNKPVPKSHQFRHTKG